VNGGTPDRKTTLHAAVFSPPAAPRSQRVLLSPLPSVREQPLPPRLRAAAQQAVDGHPDQHHEHERYDEPGNAEIGAGRDGVTARYRAARST
jgi:hypothetical protein